MSETQTTTAPVIETPSSTATTTPAPAQPAADTVTIPKAQWELTQRHAQQYAGAAPLITKLNAGGIKTEADLGSVLDLKQRFSQIGADPAQMLSAFAPPNKGGNQPASGTPEPDIAAVIDSTVNAKVAMLKHEQAFNEQNNRVGSMVDEIAGANASPQAKWLVQKAVQAAVLEAQQQSFYPSGHPLADKQFAPLSADVINKIKADVSANFTGLRGAGSTTTTPPSPGTPTGPQPGANAPDGTKRFWDLTAQERIAQTERWMAVERAKLAAAPASALGT